MACILAATFDRGGFALESACDFAILFGHFCTPAATAPAHSQGVYHVISGTYPTTAVEAVQFAALQFQAKFGAHNPASHKPGFLTRSIQEYIPSTHYQPPKTAEQWEEEIFRKHAFSTTLVSAAPPHPVCVSFSPLNCPVLCYTLWPPGTPRGISQQPLYARLLWRSALCC
jgi:hypothetical protein